MPVVHTSVRGDGFELTCTAFRAPLWPSGVDVLDYTLTNTSGSEATADLELVGPEGTAWGEREAVAGSRVIARIPAGLEPVRERREWGCATGSSKLAGWARPASDCDPAYRNIRAGMGGTPIVYEFDVRPGSEHQVLLGLCETHWRTPGQRPVELQVEGCEREIVDPVAEWGPDGVGILYFAARDRDGNGVLRVAAAPVEGSPDENPILNVIWIFGAGEHADSDDAILGKLDQQAEYKVDVGGEADQDLYKPGDLECPVTLDAGQTRRMTFLVAAPGVSVASWPDGPPSVDELEAAAADVWTDWLGATDHGSLDAPLALLSMSAAQHDLIHVALPEPGATAGPYSLGRQALMAAALDRAGAHRAAEPLLRLLWAKDLPEAVAERGQREDGTWPDPAGKPQAQAMALYALCAHALATGDRAWTEQAWPAMTRAAEALAQGEATCEWVLDAYRRVCGELDLECPKAVGSPTTGGAPLALPDEAVDAVGGPCPVSAAARAVLLNADGDA
jgi:hypothetical protein